MRWRRTTREPSVARQILLLQVLVVVVLVVSALGLAAYDARHNARTTATERAVAVARTLADSPTLVDALDDPDPSATIQPLAERVRRDSGVDFITVMNLDLIRYSHPDPSRIGGHFVGDVGDAPQGGTFTQEYAGTLGPSMRAVVPVLDGSGRVVALVSVGITIERIDRGLRDDVLLIGGAALAVLAVGLIGTWLVARRLRRATHGLGEREITRMYEYYSAVLHAVREGLLLIDDRGRVQLVNDEARRLLALPEDVVGRPVSDLGLPPGLVTAALGRTSEADDIYVAGEHVLVVSSSPATWQGREVGAVVSLRDHTELRSVTGELDVVRGLTESLRSQNHEAANRLHTVVSLIEMGRPEQAVAFATEELEVAQHLTDRMVGQLGDPVVAALLLGKSAEAAERGIELTVEGDLPTPGPAVAPRDLVTVLGNLVDNALDAVAGRPVRRVAVHLGGDADTLRVTVGDSGPGLSEEEAAHVLDRGWTTKASVDDLGGGRGVGLALVGQVARRHGGGVEIGGSAHGGAEFTVTLRAASVRAGRADA
ncbi:sensor histidine kinase [Nocardioides sp. MAHUQ-72]|uniref:sensor histidine kinase n=1 Tax=unclassified Nocardioides TaxID=2615069 RepID=UPI00360767EE